MTNVVLMAEFALVHLNALLPALLRLPQLIVCLVPSVIAVLRSTTLLTDVPLRCHIDLSIGGGGRYRPGVVTVSRVGPYSNALYYTPN